MLAKTITAACLLTCIAAGQDEKPATPQNGGIVFVGSSIFQYWTQLTQQMAPLPVLNRAIAGTVTRDWLNRLDQSVIAYHPRIVVYYCGSNDVSGGENAEAILQRTKLFVQRLHEKSPDTFFYYTAIQKAPEKRDRWDVVEAVNREMELFSHREKGVGFIDLNPILFDAKGKMRENLFLPDGLHFRPDSTAYAEFTEVVKPALMKVWSH